MWFGVNVIAVLFKKSFVKHFFIGLIFLSKISYAENFFDKESFYPQAKIYISFSMPNLSLHQWLEQAYDLKIPVFIRGLYQNSFRETQNKIMRLYENSNNKNGIAIDPLEFRRYQIRKVPALVLAMDKDHYDVVYGDVSLEAALTVIAKQGKYSKEYAERLLEKLKE